MRHWLACVIVLSFGMSACGDDPPPPPVSDASRDTAQDTGDGGTTDAGDAGVGSDAGDDDGGVIDAGPIDTGPTDAGPFDAEFPDTGPPEPVVICAPDSPRTRCEPRRCEDGYSCEDAFCRGQACVPGAPCLADDDCSAGDCIKDPDADPSDPGLCEVVRGDCSATSDCAYGFRCEGGDCVDRRIPCGFHENGCPRGYTCTFAAVEGLPFCVPVGVPCEAAFQCEPGATCADVDGDGSRECIAAGLCSSNDDCPAGESCGVDPGTSQSACQVDGPCRDGDCPDGYECIDTGVGRSRCVAVGGSCRLDSECDPQAICGAIDEADAPRCLTFDESAP